MKKMVQSTNLSIPSDKLDQGRESMVNYHRSLLHGSCLRNKMDNSRHNFQNK